MGNTVFKLNGVFAHVLSSFFFALIPLYIQLFPQTTNSNLSIAQGDWLVMQRVIWSLFVTIIFLHLTRRLKPLLVMIVNIRKWPIYICSAILIAPQYWVFIWAPLNGETLSVALGYFSMPLVMVAISYFIYKEKLSKLRILSITVAFLGVLYAYFLSDGISWVVFVIAIGYPVYFIFRRHNPVQADLGFALDNLFLLPFIFFLIAPYYSDPEIFNFSFINWFFYLGLGGIATLPMLLYLYAYSKLTISLFGLLGYVEPTLLFIVAVVLGENIVEADFPVYICIFIAVLLLVFDGLKHFKRERKVCI